MNSPTTQNVAGAGSVDKDAAEAPTKRPVRWSLRRPGRGIRRGLAQSSRRARATAMVVLVTTAGLVIGMILLTEPSGFGQSASRARPVSGGTIVRYRDLVSTDTESGTLGYASRQTVFNRLTGTITWLPSIGQVFKPGQTLFKVDGQPAILMGGTTPAYRDLTSSDVDGADVLQLNRDLRRLGFDPEHLITLDSGWQAATTRAVDAWQASRGEPETGTITLGQIVFLPGAQRITAVNTALGSTGAGASAILQTTSNHLVVTVNLDATKQSEAVVGESVTVQLPSGNAVSGTIKKVSSVAQSSGNSSSGAGSSSAPSATIPVTIKLTERHPLSGLDQAAVSVNFDQQEEKHVLSVPVSALLATAGGGYALQPATALDRLIAVTPGLFAAGYVQISGAQAYPGLLVTDSQG
jgi:multidrug efflux system membrane fusion protein